MKTINISREIKFDEFISLLNLNKKINGIGLLIRRSNIDEVEIDQKFLKIIKKNMIEIRKINEWPGTILYDDFATGYYFNVGNDFINIIIENNLDLYNMLHPNFLEDLCFLRRDFSEWFITISHEKDSYFNISEIEYSQILEEIPSLKGSLFE